MRTDRMTRAPKAGCSARPLREPALRTDRVVEMLRAVPRAGEAAGGRLPGSVLLVGETEGMLARELAGAGAAVTWYEPAGSPVAPIPAPAGVARRLFGSPYETPFGDGDFDAAASQFTLEFLDEPRRALAEWGRVLVYGGALVVVCRNELFTAGDPRPRPAAKNSFSPRGLRDLLESSGFEVRQTCTLIPDLKAPRAYRGDLGFSYRFERLPWFRDRGMLLFASAVRRPG